MSTTALTAPHAPYLTIDEVSELTRMSRPQLAQLRYRGVGPQFIRPAGTKKILYRLEDVTAWLEEGLMTSTADARH